VSPQHFSDLLHRFDFGSHGSCAPGIKELAGSSRRTVAPESLKIFFEQVGADGSEVAASRSFSLSTCFSVKFSGRFIRHQRLFVRRGSFPFVFSSLVSLALTIVDGFAHVTHDMKPVEDIDGAHSFFGDDGQIGFPHVTANKPQLPRQVQWNQNVC